MKNDRQWYRMQVQEDSSVADIYIYDFIGDWIDEMLNEMFGENITITAKAFIDELNALPDSVTQLRVHVNSPGGDVFGAVAIANALRDQRSSKGRAVETSVDALAASAASIIIQAGDPVRIADNGLIMIHNPWRIALGEAGELRKAADDLDTIREAIVATYRWNSELSAEDIGTMMDATTWMDADEAVEKGFATEKVEGLRAAASLDPRGVAKLTIPDKYKERVEALVKPKDNEESDPEPETDGEPAEPMAILRLCRENECLEIAERFIESKASIEEVTSRVNEWKEAKQQAAVRATEIRALCEKAELPELADGYIKGGMELGDVRLHLTTLTARLDKAEIDAGLEPDQGVKGKPKINVAQIYAERNRLQLGPGK